MTRRLLLALAMGATDARADEPTSTATSDACLVLNNRILGPRAPDRLLPLLSGDPTNGFHAACAVPWSKLSPANQPLPVTDCYRGGLLQVANDAACGRQTGPLWIDSRWVITGAELQDTHAHAVVCQQLETVAWTGTRNLQLDCVPQKQGAEHGVRAALASSCAAHDVRRHPGGSHRSRDRDRAGSRDCTTPGQLKPLRTAGRNCEAPVSSCAWLG